MIDANVRKKLGQFSLAASVADGGFICLAGNNGSGKSSLMKAIAGLLPIDEGRVLIDGKDVTASPVEARNVVLVVPGSLIPHLGVDAHLSWGLRLKKLRMPSDHLSKVKEALGIDFSGRVSQLSLGMRERVSLATALLSSPKVILVDEAFSNLHERREFIVAYRKLTSEAGIDVLFSTQDEKDSSLADHTYSISEGKTERRS
ncbi:MAG: ATP-binding cassette domain-containing protein [Thaumarchaeota archaeon]|nr:ATP-binding cassette domain-containing protein [Nitrososphaerota archaeon]